MTQQDMAQCEHGVAYKVRAVLAREGTELNPEQLVYMREMANRVGFTLLPSRPDDLPSVQRIQINIPMTDNEFVVILDEIPATPRRHKEEDR